MTDATQGLGRRMAKSAVWSVASRVAIKLLGIISIAILARLLTPADFGLLATATALVGVVQVLSEFSFDLALIRDQKAGRAEYDTVWTMTIIRAGITAALLAVGAGIIARFFEDDRLQPILWALAACTFIDGFANVRIVDFRKELNFQKEFTLLVATKAITFLVTVAFAVAWRNYWALVAGFMTGTVVRAALSYIMLPYLPRLTLVAWRDITNFSKWYLLTNIVAYLGQRCDTFVISKLNGPEFVGLYTAAFEIAGLITTELLFPIQRVLNPGFAKLSHDRVALKAAFTKVYSFTALMTVPAVVGIGLVADPLVRIFLGATWIAAIPLIEVLVFAQAIWLNFSTFYSVYVAVGQQRVMAYSAVLTLGLVIPGITTAVWYFGTIGAAYAQVGVACVIFAANVFWLRRILDISLGDFISHIGRPIIAAGVMAAAVIACDQFWLMTQIPPEPLPKLLVLVATGCIAYAFSILTFWYISGRPAGGETIALDLYQEHIAPIIQRRMR
jgi:O-antigen/teichoic acid export membrane protein